LDPDLQPVSIVQVAGNPLDLLAFVINLGSVTAIGPAGSCSTAAISPAAR